MYITKLITRAEPLTIMLYSLILLHVQHANVCRTIIVFMLNLTGSTRDAYDPWCGYHIVDATRAPSERPSEVQLTATNTRVSCRTTLMTRCN